MISPTKIFRSKANSRCFQVTFHVIRLLVHLETHLERHLDTINQNICDPVLPADFHGAADSENALHIAVCS